MDSLKKNQARLIILNKKDTGDTYQKILSLAEGVRVLVVDYMESTPFEKIVGKLNCQCAAVIDRTLARKILALSKQKEHDIE
jgi:hypothetical protein